MFLKQLLQQQDGSVPLHTHLQKMFPPHLLVPYRQKVSGKYMTDIRRHAAPLCPGCTISHTTAAVLAAESLMKITPSHAATTFRKLLLHTETITHHLDHITARSLPFCLDAPDLYHLSLSDEDIVRTCVTIQSSAHTLQSLFTQHFPHSMVPDIGGISVLPEKNLLTKVAAITDTMLKSIQRLVTLFASLPLPDFERDGEYAALVCKYAEYPFLNGYVASSDGLTVDKNMFLLAIHEKHSGQSPFPRLSLSRDSFRVGAQARYNLNYEHLSCSAKLAAEEMGLPAYSLNPYHTLQIKLVEVVHCLNSAYTAAKQLMEHSFTNEDLALTREEKTHTAAPAGNCFGVVESPEGTLVHQYETDENGIIRHAVCVTPSLMNLAALEELLPYSTSSHKENRMIHDAFNLCPNCLTLHLFEEGHR